MPFARDVKGRTSFTNIPLNEVSITLSDLNIWWNIGKNYESIPVVERNFHSFNYDKFCEMIEKG